MCVSNQLYYFISLGKSRQAIINATHAPMQIADIATQLTLRTMLVFLH